MEDNDWLTLVRNLARMGAAWKRMTSILIREGEETRVSGFFFKSVIQAVLLFGVETWVVNPRMDVFLGGITGPGGTAFDGAAPAVENRWEVIVQLDSNSKAGGGFLDNGGVHSAKEEHVCAVHCYVISSKPL